jgi:hypothetical protein
VPFFYRAGSEFEEMFVGVGSRRVRKLFSVRSSRNLSLPTGFSASATFLCGLPPVKGAPAMAKFWLFVAHQRIWHESTSDVCPEPSTSGMLQADVGKVMTAIMRLQKSDLK